MSSCTHRLPSPGEAKGPSRAFLSFSRMTQAGHHPGGAPAASCCPECPGRSPSHIQSPCHLGWVHLPWALLARLQTPPPDHQSVVTTGQLSVVSQGTPGQPSVGTSPRLPSPSRAGPRGCASRACGSEHELRGQERISPSDLESGKNNNPPTGCIQLL